MISLGCSIPTYLKHAQALIFGVRDDEFIKQRLQVFNCTDERIAEYIAVYYEAEQSESEKSREMGEQAEARHEAEETQEAARSLAQMHIDCIRLALYDDLKTPPEEQESSSQSSVVGSQ